MGVLYVSRVIYLRVYGSGNGVQVLSSSTESYLRDKEDSRAPRSYHINKYASE